MYEGRKGYVTTHFCECWLLIMNTTAVISRQFRDMSRARIESLLASFPKLIPTGTQHTSVETADVRYVYQPLEDLYILLITNKASNILQDIETLHLFARVVSDMCRSAEQREILKNAFELLGAFDEIVSMGYREQVNLMQVRNVLEMESHEEKIQEIIARVRPILCKCASQSLTWACGENRTRRRRRKRSSSGARSSSRCSVGSSNDALRRVVPLEAATSVVVSPDMHLFPSANTTLLRQHARPLPHPRVFARRPSRAAA